MNDIGQSVIEQQEKQKIAIQQGFQEWWEQEQN